MAEASKDRVADSGGRVVRLEEARTAVMEVVSKWFTSLEPLLTGGPAPLRDLSAKLSERRAALLGPLFQLILEQVVAEYRDLRRTHCPQCGGVIFRKRKESKAVTTLHGNFVLDRPYFYCAECHYGFSPLDEALELAEETLQFDTQELLTRFTARMAYSEAVELVELSTGVKVSEHAAHATVGRVSEATDISVVIPAAQEIARRIAEARATEPEREPVVVVSIDGAMAPLRPAGGRKSPRGKGFWKEAKGFRIFLQCGPGRVVTLASWHQITDVNGLSAALELAASRIPRAGIRFALVADGADWIWDLLRKYFPEGREILDYYHAKEHVYGCARAHYGDGVPAREWASVTMARLSHGYLCEVLGGLRRMIPSSSEAKEEIRKLLGYLEHRRDQFNYNECQQQGLPIGSGAMESHHRTIVHRRLKLPGAWWLELKGNGMLRLRCSIANGTFDDVIRRYIDLKKPRNDPKPKE